MSRDGFTIADLDVGLLSDPKIVALARRLKDPAATAAHVGLYVAIVLESWAAGDRIALEDAAPAWWLDELGGVQEQLVAVGLVDADGRIPERAWSSWFLPAFERRELRRAAGAMGGKASGARRLPKHPRSNGAAVLNPSDPTDRTEPIPFPPVSSPQTAPSHRAREGEVGDVV